MLDSTTQPNRPRKGLLGRSPRQLSLACALLLLPGAIAGCATTVRVPAPAARVTVVAPAAPKPAAKPVIAVRVTHRPPEARREARPRRPSYRHVWVGGYWSWSSHRGAWLWKAGAWRLPPRGKAVWVAPRCERRSGGWVFLAGYWR